LKHTTKFKVYTKIGFRDREKNDEDEKYRNCDYDDYYVGLHTSQKPWT